MNDTSITVLDTIIELTERDGVCPTLGEIVRVTKIPRPTVTYAIVNLLRSGHLSQACGHGAPLRPLMTSDGLRFEIRTRRVHP